MTTGAFGPKIAIVTGAASGIGRAVVIQLVHDGWRIAAVDRDDLGLAQTQSLADDPSGECMTISGDVTSALDVTSAVQQVVDVFGGLTALVNNAAIMYPGPLTDVTEQQWDRTFAVNVKGAFLMSRAVVPVLKAAGGGSIVNMSSPDAYGRKGLLAYASSKGAINTLTTCMAADHLADGIRVNAVLPGPTMTGMSAQFPAARLQEFAGRTVARRLATADEVASLVAFLLSRDAETITGGFFGGRPLPST